MQREIKFRAWDKKEKNITEWEKLTDNFDFGKMLYNEYDEYYEFEVMQYTGLKDKNGVEIYEGDIIVWEYSEKPQEVFWDNSICGFSTKHYHLWRTVKKVKIVGNIYENPELLEGLECQIS